MTVALSVLGLGLAVAALAGIPAFVENRAIGDAMTVAGFAVTAVGLVLVLLAAPGQRRQNRFIERSTKVDIEQLKVERRALLRTKAEILPRLVEARKYEERTRTDRIMAGNRLNAREELRLVEGENSVNEDSLERNTNEFARIGIDDPDKGLNNRDL